VKMNFLVALVFAIVASVNAKATTCSAIKSMKKCSADPDCKWTGLANGSCGDRMTFTPSSSRTKPKEGCDAVHSAAGCATWSECEWDASTNQCVGTPSKPSAKPTKPVPTNKPSPAPTPAPSPAPTAHPIVPKKCGSFMTKTGCCGPAYAAGKPCVNAQVPTGCYWNGSKCLPKAG